jgi:hypothetical protein
MPQGSSVGVLFLVYEEEKFMKQRFPVFYLATYIGTIIDELCGVPTLSRRRSEVGS